MPPKVLISDDLSPAAIAIFKQRGVDGDVKVGLAKEELEKIIGGYDGLAIRSATKVTEKIIAAANNLKVIGRAGIGVDNVDVKAATAKGIIVMNTPFGNSVTTAEHAIIADAGARAANPGRRSLHASRQVGKDRNSSASRWRGKRLASSAAATSAASSPTVRWV